MKAKILLMGNPNVGKSVFFSRLTGVNAVSSNYAGTTVSFMKGDFVLDGSLDCTLIDVPGTYSLKSSNKAEAIAAEFVAEGADAIICVLDASNLERNLCLALELQRYKLPTVYALNLTDVAERRGISINSRLLAEELSAPVVETIAVKNQGIDLLKQSLSQVLTRKSANENCGCDSCPNKGDCGGNYSSNARWSTAKLISKRVTVRKAGDNPAFLDILGGKMMQPFPGIPIAVVIMAALIAFVVGGGELLRTYLLEPLVDNVIVVFFEKIFTSFIPSGVFLNILVGEYGIFRIGFEWILALILPYVFLFYSAFSFLEDSGYLPRISVLFDNIMRKIGVQGGSLIYAIMGFGCAAPAIIGSRAASSKKERLIISTAVCFAVPCISQTGALIALISAHSWKLFPALILLSIVLFISSALIAGKFIKGRVSPLIIEVPNLLLPEPSAYFRKLGIRMKHFLIEAEFPMLIAIIVAAVLKESGALESIAVAAGPIVSVWLGLPQEAVIALILGFIRREMSVAPLLALDLTELQAFIGGAVSLMYLPCLSVFAILVKEFKLKTAVIIAVGTTFTALFLGGLINQVARILL